MTRITNRLKRTGDVARRLWNGQISTRAITTLVISALTMSMGASAIAAVAFARVGPQVRRIDKLQGVQTAQIRRIDRLQRDQAALVAAARKQSHALCIRSMKISPPLADDYRDRRVFQRYLGERKGTDLLHEAIASIPKKCP